MAFNSGLFYIRANARTVDLLTRIAGGGPAAPAGACSWRGFRAHTQRGWLVLGGV